MRINISNNAMLNLNKANVAKPAAKATAPKAEEKPTNKADSKIDQILRNRANCYTCFY